MPSFEKQTEFPTPLEAAISVEHVPLRGYNQRSVERLASKTGLALEDTEDFLKYLRHLRIEPQELQGKDVLDIGSADNAFKKGVQTLVQTGHFVGLDDFQEKLDPKTKDVVGDALALPFKDESFDMVVAKHSVPVMFMNLRYLTVADMTEKIRTMLYEAVRVTKKGGTVRIVPFDFFDFGAGGRGKVTIKDDTFGIGQEGRRLLMQLKQDNPNLEYKFTFFDTPADKRFHPSFPQRDTLLEILKK